MTDRDIVSNANWYALKWRHGFYARRSHGAKPYLHRALITPPPGCQIDHINGNGLDNRRKNLRVATISQNHANAQRQARGSSAFKGVHWAKREHLWRAKIGYDGKAIYLGYFKNESAAAQAYQRAAQLLYGEFAVHNRTTL